METKKKSAELPIQDFEDEALEQKALNAAYKAWQEAQKKKSEKE